MFINIINNVIINIATHFSRELSVIETLEADGTTKETSEETIKIGQEEVCLTILDYFEHFFDRSFYFSVFYVSVNSERRDGNCVREDVQVKILIFSANF